MWKMGESFEFSPWTRQGRSSRWNLVRDTIFPFDARDAVVHGRPWLTDFHRRKWVTYIFETLRRLLRLRRRRELYRKRTKTGLAQRNANAGKKVPNARRRGVERVSVMMSVRAFELRSASRRVGWLCLRVFVAPSSSTRRFLIAQLTDRGAEKSARSARREFARKKFPIRENPRPPEPCRKRKRVRPPMLRLARYLPLAPDSRNAF